MQNNMSNNKQSSIELFIEQLEEKSWENASMNRIEICMNVEEYLALKEQVKAMHKEEILDAFYSGGSIGGVIHHESEKYYNETYGGNND